MDAHLRDARLLQWADRFSANGDYFETLDGQCAKEAVSSLQLSLGDLAGLEQPGIPVAAKLLLLRSAQAAGIWWVIAHRSSSAPTSSFPLQRRPLDVLGMLAPDLEAVDGAPAVAGVGEAM